MLSFSIRRSSFGPCSDELPVGGLIFEGTKVWNPIAIFHT